MMKLSYICIMKRQTAKKNMIILFLNYAQTLCTCKLRKLIFAQLVWMENIR